MIVSDGSSNDTANNGKSPGNGSGYEVESSGHGYCRLRLLAKNGHCNRTGRVKGAVLYSLIEASMHSASRTVIESRTAFLTDLELRFLVPMHVGSIFCETKVLHFTDKHAVLETNVVNEDGVVCLRASGSFYIG